MIFKAGLSSLENLYDKIFLHIYLTLFKLMPDHIKLIKYQYISFHFFMNFYRASIMKENVLKVLPLTVAFHWVPALCIIKFDKRS